MKNHLLPVLLVIVSLVAGLTTTVVATGDETLGLRAERNRNEKIYS